MSLKRWDARRDASEKSIVEALERVGCLVKRLSDPGGYDLLVYVRGRFYGLEIKEKAGKLTKAQAKERDKGWPSMIAKTPEQALHLLGLVG